MAERKPAPPRKRIVVYWFASVKPPEPVAKEAARAIQESTGMRPVMVYVDIPYDDLRDVKKILSKLRRPHTIAIVAVSPRVLGKLFKSASNMGVVNRIYVPVIEVASWPPAEKDGYGKYCVKGRCYAVKLATLVTLAEAVKALEAVPAQA